MSLIIIYIYIYIRNVRSILFLLTKYLIFYFRILEQVTELVTSRFFPCALLRTVTKYEKKKWKMETRMKRKREKEEGGG